MFTFDIKLDNKNFSKGTNTCEFIILHHTGSTNFNGDLRVLSGQTARQVSCHFLVGYDKVAKIGHPEQIQRHAGESEWGTKKGMNSYAIGIEITGPGFNDYQKKTVKALVEHLMQAYKIPKTNILRHADITHAKSKNKVLRTQGTLSRKRDVSPEFFPNADFPLWRSKLSVLSYHQI